MFRKLNAREFRNEAQRRGIGDYGASDPNTHPRGYGRYSEKEIFRASMPGVDPELPRSDGLTNPPLVANINAWQLYMFTIFPGTEQVVQANPRRTALLIQNQSNVNLRVNFGSAASPTVGVKFAPGEGLIEDVEPPANSIWYAFESTPTGIAILVEGAYAL